MSTVALSRTTLRDYSATVAQLLAIGLIAFIPIANSVTTVLSILLPLACILYMDKTTWQMILRNPTSMAILLLVVLSIIAIPHSIGATKDVTLALRKNIRLLYFMFLVPLFIQAKWRNIANITFLTAVFISVIAAMIHTWAYFKDPIFTSLFVAFAIFMLAHYSWEYKKYRNIAIVLAACFTFYLFFLGTGRVGQLLFFMLAALFCAQRFRITFKMLATSMILFGMLFLTLILLPSSFITRQKLAIAELEQYIHSSEDVIMNESSLGVRLILAHNTWHLIMQKPLFGWGTGAFRAAYAQHAPETKVKKIVRTNPHNQYLLTWMELGLPGLVILCTLFGTLIWAFYPMRTLEGYLGMGLVVAIIIGCTMNSWLLDMTSAFFFTAMSAVYMGARYDCLAGPNRVK